MAGRGAGGGRWRASGSAAALLVLALGAPCLAGEAAVPWRELAPGLELARFPERGGTGPEDALAVLRVDPRLWELTLHAISATGEASGRTAREWCREHGLVAAVNAGMFAADRRTHVGYFRDGDHFNNRRLNHFRSVAAFAPREPDLPAFRIYDREEPGTPWDRYGRAVQNLRLIARPGVNRWEPQERRWSEAALAEDAGGRALLVFSPVPRSMHDFNARLLGLPLDVVSAQHLEGGSYAQLYVDAGGVRLELAGMEETGFFTTGGVPLPVPNVIGVRRRPTPAPGTP